jgi:glycosyltransferase involved in cell wall biosynthesis
VSPAGHRRARPVRIGAVSIVVAELDGVGTALDELADLDLPGAGHEVVVPVRGPGRAPRRIGGLEVREVRVDDRMGAAAVRNAAAGPARGEYLAFLGPGARPDPGWLRGALAAFRDDARVAAVVARGPDDPDDPPVVEVLGGPAAAVVVETRAFQWVDGYPADAGPGAAAVELGWRLWRAGMRVVSVAGSRVVPGAPEPDTADAPVEHVRFLWATADAEPAHRAVVRAREVLPLAGIDPGPARVLVVTPDVLAPRMAGPAIRAYELARALAAAPEIGGVELVSIVACDLPAGAVPARAVDEAGLRAAVTRADVVLVQGHVLDHHPWLADTDRVLIVDAYDPIQLEVLEQSRELPIPQRRTLVRLTAGTIDRLLARGDRFLVASPKQRDLLVGQLLATGRLNASVYDGDPGLHDLIGIVPFGVPDEAPVATGPALRGVVPGIGPDDPLVLWGGGVYNWFDPLTLLHAVDRLRTRVPTVRCFFMGMHHPHPDVPEMEMARRTRALAHQLGLVGSHVFFNDGWIPYDERAAYLLEADVGVSTHLDHVETAFSFRTRILDYLWAALPVVATAGDAVGDLVAARGFGRTVPPGDVDALAAALEHLCTDRAANRACRDAIGAARSDLTWSRAAAPLVTMAARPQRAPDLVDPRERAVRGDRAAAAVWGVGWEASARGAWASLRRGEWDDLADKVQRRWAARP